MNSRKWRKSLRRSIVPIALLWGVMFLGWLALNSQDAGGRPLTILWGADPEMFDPQRTSNAVASDVFRHVCEPLFYEDGQGIVRGLLAQDEWRVSEDGRGVTVMLRPGITFHDGAPLDAAAVQRSFERLQRLGASPLLSDLRQVQVEAQPDGMSVQLTLPEPDYEFVRFVLSNPYAAIVSPHATDEVAAGFVACTGPYQFRRELYRPQETLTLTRYRSYRWPPALFTNQGPAHIPQLRFVFEAERAERLAALMAGEGCVLSLSQEDLDQAAGLPQMRLYTASGGVTYLGFNFQKARWQDLRARQAVALALDKTALAAAGPFAVLDTPLAPNAAGYDPAVASAGYAFDPAQSRGLLSQAGQDYGQAITLLIPESATYRTLAALVQQQLEAAGLGPVQVREKPRSRLLNERQDFDLLLFDYAWADYAALSIFLGPGPRNLLNYAQGDIAGWIRQARATADPTLRQQLVNQAQRAVLEQAIWQPLLTRRITFAVHGACLAGERQSPYGELLFHDADTRVGG
ncbi:MAG: ABC transporter substrate-binding protein [Caldilineales bacterium]